MYTWNYSEHDEVWEHDQFETKEECVKDAIYNYILDKEDTIAIGTVCRYVPCPDIESMLEHMEYNAYEECGEFAEGWNISTRKGHEAEFDELCNKVASAVNEYLEKTENMPTFYTIEDIYTIELKDYGV